eukprot:10230158-Ditylum_brightwellii.AAC.1
MDMQQQDRFIFTKSIDQWENCTLTEMKQWVTSNKACIKFCLGVGLKQKQLHSLDIRNYISNTTHMNAGIQTRHDRGRAGSKGGRKKTETKQGKQADIRDTIEDSRSRYKKG